VQAEREDWPRHVAVIMDGNGRWARLRGLPRVRGHRAGIKSAEAAIETCREIGVRVLTLYTFSIENWRRPKAEVDELMRLLHAYLGREGRRLVRDRVRFLPVGRLGMLPERVRARALELAAATAGFPDFTLCLALSYGGRAEILDAAAALASRPAPGGGVPDEAAFRSHLYAPGVPDPDLLVRTSGERRLSNFLLFQAARARLVFVDDLWPDFGKGRFRETLLAARRERAAEARTA